MKDKVSKMKSKNSVLALVLFILFTEGVGALSGLLGMTGTSQYEKLIKPSFSPPSIIFPVVWTILYFLMAVAAYIIWVRGQEGQDVRKALTLYGIQLFFNFIWSILFFRFRLYEVAFFDLVLLVSFVLLTIFEFYKIDKRAAFLMIPYIVWISFAGVLNYAIWQLNK